MWHGHEKSADPGDGERQRKIAGDWLAVKEGFALDGTRLLLHARRIGSFVVHGDFAQSLRIRRL
jgi:hypothetical protein